MLTDVLWMIIQVVMMGCALALENIHFVNAAKPEEDIIERFASTFSRFFNYSEVHNVSEVLASFRRMKTRIDATVD